MKPTLYNLVGLPYSGKSTLTKTLADKFGLQVVSVDSEIKKRGLKVDQMSQENWNLVYSEAYKQIRLTLQSGKSTLFDMGNLKRLERATARLIAQENGADYKLIYVKTPIGEIKRRWEANAKTKERGQLSQNGLDRALEMWEEPSSEEGPLVFNYSDNIGEWVEANINQFS